MSDYISREAALNVNFKIPTSFFESKITTARKAVQEYANEIAKLPAADVRPVVRAHWTDHRTIEHDGEWYCTACGKEITIYMGADRKDRYKFCPNCGARMEES